MRRVRRSLLLGSLGLCAVLLLPPMGCKNEDFTIPRPDAVVGDGGPDQADDGGEVGPDQPVARDRRPARDLVRDRQSDEDQPTGLDVPADSIVPSDLPMGDTPPDARGPDLTGDLLGPDLPLGPDGGVDAGADLSLDVPLDLPAD